MPSHAAVSARDRAVSTTSPWTRCCAAAERAPRSRGGEVARDRTRCRAAPRPAPRARSGSSSRSPCSTSRAPTRDSLALGAAIGVLGEAIRIWAAGHLEKSREVTSSGPYRFTRHPLYLGSSIMALGIAVGCRSIVVAALVLLYMAATIARGDPERGSVSARRASATPTTRTPRRARRTCERAVQRSSAPGATRNTGRVIGLVCGAACCWSAGGGWRAERSIDGPGAGRL